MSKQQRERCRDCQRMVDTSIERMNSWHLCEPCADERAREREYDRQEERGIDRWRGLE